eukprot:1007253-Pleurochrysis_carterae.AAC.1
MATRTSTSPVDETTCSSVSSERKRYLRATASCKNCASRRSTIGSATVPSRDGFACRRSQSHCSSSNGSISRVPSTKSCRSDARRWISRMSALVNLQSPLTSPHSRAEHGSHSVCNDRLRARASATAPLRFTRRPAEAPSSRLDLRLLLTDANPAPATTTASEMRL